MQFYYGLILSLFFGLNATALNAQVFNSCAAASAGAAIANGACVNNASFGGSVNMSGQCVGGNNPAMFIKFVAGNCSQFTISPDFNLGNNDDFGAQIISSSCGAVSGFGAECYGNLVQNQTLTVSGINILGSAQLTPGTTYILLLYGNVGSGTVDICYNANVIEQPSNECT